MDVDNHYSKIEDLETNLTNNNLSKTKLIDKLLVSDYSPMSPTPPLSVKISNFIFRVVSMVLRFIFSLVYNQPGKKMPPIQNPILLESATSLARKIRCKEVNHHLELVSLNSILFQYINYYS